MKYIVQGNYSMFKVTLTQRSGELIQPYIPTATDEVNISLRGARVYEYKEYEQSSNVLTFADNGCLKVGLYELEVRIIDSEQHRLRCMYRKQVMVVASNDDIPTNASFSDDDVQLSGQFDIVASTEIVVDDELSLTSTNPVQNKVVTAALREKVGEIQIAEEQYEGIRIYYNSDITTHAPISWATIPYASTQAAGVMSAADKTKLDGIEAGANKTLFDNEPTADSTKAVTSGGMFNYYRGAFFDFNYTPTAENWEVSFLDKENNERLSITFDCANTVEGIAGLMSLADKTKLDALPTNSELQTALDAKGGTLAGGLSAPGYEIELKSGNTTLSAVYVPYANAQTDGLMSASDYAKLAALPTNAALTAALNGKQDTLTFDSVPTQGSENPVTSGGLYNVLGDIESILDNILGN